MPGRNFLFVPGPTNVPERILRAMDRAMEDHRSSAFPELTTGLFRGLEKVFKTTTGQAFIGLRESLAIMFEEGLENIFARHHRLAEGVRAAVRAWGLKLCARAPKWHSDTVSAIMVPEGFSSADVIDVALRRSRALAKAPSRRVLVQR